MIREYIENVGGILLMFALFDLVILSGMLMNIAHGANVPHIAFWDAQVKFLFGWLTK